MIFLFWKEWQLIYCSEVHDNPGEHDRQDDENDISNLIENLFE